MAIFANTPLKVIMRAEIELDEAHNVVSGTLDIITVAMKGKSEHDSGSITRSKWT